MFARPAGAPKEMLSVVRSPDGTPTKVRINYSSLDIIQSCPRKAWYLLKRGIRSQVESPATVYGTAIHKALEVFYSHPSAVRELPRDFLKHAELMAAGVPAPEEHFLYDAIQSFVRAAAPLATLPESDKRSLSTGVWTLWHYFQTYIKDEYVVHCDENGPITERLFSLPLCEVGGICIELFGTIDCVLRHERTGVILPCDHKTSSVVGNDFYSRLKPNAQYTGYLLGAREVLGLDTDSFLVNCIQVKPRPVTARGQPPHFPRQVTKRTEEDFAELRDMLAEAVANWLHWDATDVWPLGPVNSCTMYGGCSFLEVCAAPHSIRENILKAKFTEGYTNAT
jgi:hypothetical protein